MTYSIVARDPGTGEMGVAVQSHYFSVGSVVAWGEPGVGVVATQAQGERSYGPLGLDLMRGGKTAPDALRALLAADTLAEHRQVAMLDAAGNIEAHTGEACIVHAGHVVGANASVQANMMLTDTVPGAMAAAFESGTGNLIDRLLAALDAAEAEGGDIRGRQSAAILVVSGDRSAPAFDRVLELRVEDHPEPLDELRRLVGVKRAYDQMSRGAALVRRGDLEAARREYEAAQAAVPDNVEFVFWQAVALANFGRIDEARANLERTQSDSGAWAKLLRRLPAAGLLPQEALAELER